MLGAVRPTSEYMVRCIFGLNLSVALRPSNIAHSGGGRAAGGNASRSSENELKFCRRRIMMNDISLYANLKEAFSVSQRGLPKFRIQYLLPETNARARVESAYNELVV